MNKELERAAISCAEVDGWKLDPANKMRKEKYWRKDIGDPAFGGWMEASETNLVTRYLDLNNLVPVWEKLGKDATLSILTRMKMYTFKPDAFDSESIQEEALIATGQQAKQSSL